MSDDFMQLVENHERQWGTQRYQGRPSLNELLNAHIVAVWRIENEARAILTIHTEFHELEIYFYRLLFRPAGETKQHRKLVRIYQDRARMVAKNLRITFVPLES